MHISQDNWTSIAAELTRRLRADTRSHKVLSVQTGIDYYAIRRMRKAGVFSRTNNALALCIFFCISDENQDAGRDDLQELIAAVSAVWDGSAGHARLIRALLEAVKGFRVTGG